MAREQQQKDVTVTSVSCDVSLLIEGVHWVVLAQEINQALGLYEHLTWPFQLSMGVETTEIFTYHPVTNELDASCPNSAH